jgi:hypothetical protein
MRLDPLTNDPKEVCARHPAQERPVKAVVDRPDGATYAWTRAAQEGPTAAWCSVLGRNRCLQAARLTGYCHL